MSVNDESAGRRAADEDATVNADGSVGVGTDGSLVSEIDREEEGGVGVGTDGSLVSHAEDRHPHHGHRDDHRDHDHPDRDNP
jgi:hypothetical protein